MVARIGLMSTPPAYLEEQTEIFENPMGEAYFGYIEWFWPSPPPPPGRP